MVGIVFVVGLIVLFVFVVFVYVLLCGCVDVGVSSCGIFNEVWMMGIICLLMEVIIMIDEK